MYFNWYDIRLFKLILGKKLFHLYILKKAAILTSILIVKTFYYSNAEKMNTLYIKMSVNVLIPILYVYLL